MTDVIEDRKLPEFDFCGKIFGSVGGAFQYQCNYCTDNYSFAGDFELHVLRHLVKEYTFNVPVEIIVSPDTHCDEVIPDSCIKAEPIQIDVEYNDFDSDNGDSFGAPEVGFLRFVLVSMML